MELAKRKAFANELKDSEHLIAVAASANRSKGAKDPAEWFPPQQGFLEVIRTGLGEHQNPLEFEGRCCRVEPA